MQVGPEQRFRHLPALPREIQPAPPEAPLPLLRRIGVWALLQQAAGTNRGAETARM